MADNTDKQQHIGDGVYADFDGYQIVLTAESGGQKNVIYLPGFVLENLNRYADRLRAANQEADKKESEGSPDATD